MENYKYTQGDLVCEIGLTETEDRDLYIRWTSDSVSEANDYKLLPKSEMARLNAWLSAKLAEKIYRLYIFDVDWTLVETKSGGTFRKMANDWKLMDGRLEKCVELRKANKLIGLASNQNGAAFEWSSYTPQQIRKEIDDLARLIGAEYVETCIHGPNPKCLEEWYHPDHPDRKPNPGMMIKIMAAAGVLPIETIMIGDRDEDELAAKKAGIDFVWAKDFFKQANQPSIDEIDDLP